MAYLFQHLLPYLLLAFAIGLIVGWMTTDTGREQAAGEDG